uniref:Uncharacterized protein n=1 Tax=Neovison vison TaxID=452646 RepID=A0A8C7EQ38_NEOVI
MQKSCQENEGKPQNMPKGRPPFGRCPTGAEGNLKGGPAQAGQGFKEDTPVRHLDPEEMVRGIDELERLREEIRRVRNNVLMLSSFYRPFPPCIILNSFSCYVFLFTKIFFCQV